MSSIKERLKTDHREDEEFRKKIQDIFSPHWNKKESEIAVQFGVPKDGEEQWGEAIRYASAQSSYSTTKVGALTIHRVEFRSEQAREIYRMYQLLQESPHLEIFIDGMPLPYAATLWLPLLWFYL